MEPCGPVRIVHKAVVWSATLPSLAFPLCAARVLVMAPLTVILSSADGVPSFAPDDSVFVGQGLILDLLVNGFQYRRSTATVLPTTGANDLLDGSTTLRRGNASVISVVKLDNAGVPQRSASMVLRLRVVLEAPVMFVPWTLTGLGAYWPSRHARNYWKLVFCSGAFATLDVQTAQRTAQDSGLPMDFSPPGRFG